MTNKYGNSWKIVCSVTILSNKNIDFTLIFRFPKDPELQNKWTLKCRRGDSMNPCSSYMCSEHFSDDTYVRDLKAELLGNYIFN